MKYFMKLSFALLNLLPSKLQGRIVRKMIKISPPSKTSSRIIYKIAQTRDEKEQAYRLVRKSYIRAGIEVIKDSDINLNKYFLLPSTITFIAVRDGVVLGTVTQILDSGLGLPIDSFADISDIRNSSKRIAEFSFLSIRKKWRGSHNIYISLAFFAVNYVNTHLGVDTILSITDLKGGMFMRGIFGFKRIKTNSKIYKKAKSKASTAQVLKVRESQKFIKKHYDGKHPSKNLYRYLFHSKLKNQCLVEDKAFPILGTPVLSKNDIKYFYFEKSAIGDQIRKNDQLVLNNLINKSHYFGKMRTNNYLQRFSYRFLVHMKGTIKIKNRLYTVRVSDLSKNGAQVVLENFLINEFEKGSIQGQVQLNESLTTEFTGEVIWKDSNRLGVEFRAVGGEINSFLNYAYLHSWEGIKEMGIENHVS